MDLSMSVRRWPGQIRLPDQTVILIAPSAIGCFIMDAAEGVWRCRRLEVRKNKRGQEQIMRIEKNAMAGTLESSDALVTVEPGEGSVELEISSSVMNQYGRQIRATVLATLDRLGVTSGRVTVVDKGALDCTLKARVECAVLRSCGKSDAGIPWGGVIR